MSARRVLQAASGQGRILAADEAEALARRIFALARGGGETRAEISSWWNGELRWARNRVSLAGDRRDVQIRVTRLVDGDWATAWTNQVDDAALEGVVRAAERSVGVYGSWRPPREGDPPVPPYDHRQGEVWSDATYGLTTEERGAMIRGVIAPAEAQRMLSAGYLEQHAGSRAKLSSLRAAGPYGPWWDEPYVRWTQARCSMTVRDPSGMASGWAGLTSYDLGRIDASQLAARALEKCLASRHPVALEPGRYTVILEPQAVADLVEPLMSSLVREAIGTPWAAGWDSALRIERYKLGLKVMDERISIGYDPADPRLGILNVPGFLMGPITWIDHGVLTNLECARETAVETLGSNLGVLSPVAYRMSGGQASVEDMIRTTRRGLLVTRFDGVDLTDSRSLLCDGLTRDGLWLVEDGKITRAVRNFRFTESPLFVLNSLDEIGEPVPVFRPSRDWLSPALVPPLKAHDFSFTSLIDAI